MSKLQKWLFSVNCVLAVAFLLVFTYSRLTAKSFIVGEVGEPYKIDVKEDTIVKEETVVEDEKQSISEDVDTIKPNKLININTASKEELMSIKGIGEVTANKILLFLSNNGKIDTLDELLEVDGIGEAKLKIIKKYAYVGG